MLSVFILAALAVLSCSLLAWQWLVAYRFPLHKRVPVLSSFPPVSLLKPLKGADEHTRESLRSWFVQDYPAQVQILFGVDSLSDPVCAIVQALQRQYPQVRSALQICQTDFGPNAKVAKLIELHRHAEHDLFVVSDADVRVPPDILQDLVTRLSVPGVGLVNCFYRLENSRTFAMRWEAVAVNADFWSQVLQSLSLQPMDFSLGAVMGTSRQVLHQVGGFGSLVDYLADDYQLGNRIARLGLRLELSGVVAECWSAPLSFAETWHHQVRWARTIRVCRPLSYFFSILSNPTLWPLLWVALRPSPAAWGFLAMSLSLRALAAVHLQWRLSQRRPAPGYFFVPWLKDLLQVAVWMAAFIGNTVDWCGSRLRLRQDGKLTCM